jgi:hypothetical protein
VLGEFFVPEISRNPGQNKWNSWFPLAVSENGVSVYHTTTISIQVFHTGMEYDMYFNTIFHTTICLYHNHTVYPQVMAISIQLMIHPLDKSGFSYHLVKPQVFIYFKRWTVGPSDLTG